MGRTVKVHELKCWPSLFAEIREGRKTAEFRRDDRGFAEGDVLWLREWEPANGLGHRAGLQYDAEGYSGKSLLAKVTCHESGAFGIPEGYCNMSIRLMHDSEEQ